MAERDHFLVLDGLRGVAAVAVAWFHLHFVVGYDCAGPLAVDLFFLLSGFVVAAAYDRRLDTDLSVGAFVRKRLVRLYPMFLTGLVLAVLVQEVLIARGAGMLHERDTLLSFPLEALWLPSPFDGGSGWTFPVDGPAWSLSLEVLINLLFAVLHRRLSDRVLAGLTLVSLTVLVTMVVAKGTINQGWSWATLPVGLARVGFAFPLGVLMYRHRERIPMSLGRVPAWVPLAALALLLLAPERVPIDIAFLLVGAPLLIATGFRMSSGRLAPLCRRLGDISYPLYAVHAPLVLLVQGAAKRLASPALGPLFGIGAVAGMVAVAVLLANWDVEVRAWLDRLLTGRRRASTLAT
ncbi:MAG: acyltransferase family protein [Sphingomonas sp.]